MENVGKCFGHLEYFIYIWNVLCPFGMFCVHLVYFPQLCTYVVRSKIWQPWYRVVAFLQTTYPLAESKLVQKFE
jgi:hypothetical protein